MKNFTAFSHIDFEFVDGINVFAGENGTGKTHVLKILYAIQKYFRDKKHSIFQEVFPGSFLIDTFSSIARGNANKIALSGQWSGNTWNLNLDLISHGFWKEDLQTELELGEVPFAVFVPATEMIGHTQGYLSISELYEIDFDVTYRDIVLRLLAPKLRDDSSLIQVAKDLESPIGGTIELEMERFYVRSNGSRMAMPMVGEGIRKLATLHQLLSNGMIRPGSVLLWDEPEANLNPSLMDELISALLQISRAGVQIFLATHSYIILKELQLQKTEEDKVRFFAFAKGEKPEDGVTVKPANSYAEISPNPIADQYLRLYDLELDKRLGPKK
ncbi:MAG: AAA family ATPase [Fimbriimonas sp.]